MEHLSGVHYGPTPNNELVIDILRWQYADTGLLHPILVLRILYLLWKFQGLLWPYSQEGCFYKINPLAEWVALAKVVPP